MKTHNLLMQLGFGNYEARAYVGLLKHGPCNGYELAKATGMPRANVYSVLKQLVERGAARHFETATGSRYSATSARDYLARLDHEHQQKLEAANDALRSLQPEEPAAPVFNLDSRQEMLARARQMIDSATDCLIVAIQPAEAGQLAENLRQARERGVQITTLCLEACPSECGGCQGHIHRLDVLSPEQPRWLVLVADRATALLGQPGPDGAHGLVTSQPLVLELADAYVRQSIALTLLGDELASQFSGLLSAQARKTLQHLYPDGTLSVATHSHDDAPDN